MNKMFALFGFLMTLFAAAIAWAQEVVPVTNEEFLKLLLESVGGYVGASTMAIVLISVKLIVAFLGTDFAGNWFKKLTGEGKLTIVLVLTFVGGVVGLMMPPTNMALGAALLHSTSLSMFTVALNQIYKYFIASKKV